MKGFLKKCHLPEHLEILFMLIIGILLQMTDGSPFSMKERWILVWETELPAKYFSPFIQKIIKTILSMIVAVRCATTYAYVVSAMLVIFCLLKKTAPKLMLLWLLIAGVKSLLMTLLEALTGVYVCSAFGKIRKACIEFFISKAMEIIFAAYLWGNVLNIYQDMERMAQDGFNLLLKEQYLNQRMDFGCLRARSLLDESTLYKTACLNNFEFKDVPQIILQMLRRDEELSEDSLIGPGMMLASVSNMGSFDNLKTSQSLGELGFTDLQTTQVVGLEDDENLSYKEKALRFLKLTKNDVKKIKLNRTSLEKDIFIVDEEVWKRVIASGTRINKPKEARTEVFIRDIPQNVTGEETIVETHDLNKFEYKFGFSLSNLFNENSFLDEESLTNSQDEESDDERATDLFMSNIKEGTIVQRHHLNMAMKKARGNEYAHLYKQDFMSRIGPEVFDKATKLPKVTSLTKRPPGLETRVAVSSPVIPKVNQIQPQAHPVDPKENEMSSSSGLHQPNKKDTVQDRDSIYRNKKDNNKVEELTKGTINEENHVESLKTENENREAPEDQEDKVKTNFTVQSFTTHLSSVFDSPSTLHDYNVRNLKETKTKPCFKKQKNLLKKMIKRKPKTLFRNSSLSSQCSSQNSDSGSDLPFESSSAHYNDSVENYTSRASSYSGGSSKKYSGKEGFMEDNKTQIHFLLELLQQPLVDVLMTYYKLKNKVNMNRKESVWFQKQNMENFNFLNRIFDLNKYGTILHSLDFDLKEKKIWKSKVLKTVENWNKQKSPLTSGSYLEVLRKKSILKKLIKYEILHAIKKGRHFSRKEKKNLAQSVIKDCRDESTSNDQNTNFEKENTSNSFIDSKAECIINLNFQNNSNVIQTTSHQNHCNEENKKITYCSSSKISSEIDITDLIDNKINKKNLTDNSRRLCNFKNEANFCKMKTNVKDNYDVEAKEKISFVTSSSEGLNNDPEGSICSQESDEPISLYYSKAANLASPLLDMKRFIYPDHIHYSYKHVKKKGFDVDISGGFPLLVRENLAINLPVKVNNESVLENPECEIKRRPMDLSFANTNAFADWKNNDQLTLISPPASRAEITDILCSSEKEQKALGSNLTKSKKSKKNFRHKKNERSDSRPYLKETFIKSRPRLYSQNLHESKYFYNARDFALIEKLIKMHMRFNSNERTKFNGISSERTPVQISSTQLHSNKGRISSTYNPAISLQENRSKNEKKRIETQEKRTSDMFARLKREALLQNKNVQKSLGSHHKPL